jgi:hypothetical protein
VSRWGHPRVDHEARHRAILAAITEAAEAGEQCPTNQALGKRAGIPGPQNVPPILRKLEAAGLIRSTFGPRQRIITILATGKSTASARDLAEARPARRPPANEAIGGIPKDRGKAAGSASRQDREKSLHRPYHIGPTRQTPPTPRELRTEGLRLIEEFARTKGVLRLDGKLQTVWTNEEAVAALKGMGLTVRRGHLYSSVGGRKVLTNKLIDHANMMLQERQTVRVRQEPEGMRA